MSTEFPSDEGYLVKIKIRIKMIEKTASVGLEPTVFSLEGRRSIHFATGL